MDERIDELRRKAQELTGRRAALLQQLASYGARLSALDRERDRARGDADALRRIESARAELLAARADEAETIRRFDGEWSAGLGRLRLDPCEVESDVPLLLLPVRLETRLVREGRSTQLKVRIYPDEIHIDQLERGLTDEEREAGIEYWTGAWRADEAVAAEAWARLLGRVHSDRAAWVVHATTPVTAQGDGDDPDAAPRFPETEPYLDNRPVARLLPDRFVATAICDGGARRVSEQGNPIAPELRLGIVPESWEETGTPAPEEDDRLPFGQGSEWLVDFEAALDAGMAITLDLGAGVRRVDQLFVYGVRHSLDPAATAQELQQLLLSHRFGEGLAFVPQGTPTNNTELERAGFRAEQPEAPLPSAAVTPEAGGNADLLAKALGIDSGVLAGVEHANGTDNAKARASNTVFWYPSWGTYLHQRSASSGDRVADRSGEEVRCIHRDHVHGRGPLPAVRIGEQPYGVLPVGATDRLWRASGREEGILKLLRRLRDKQWRPGLERVRRAHPDDPEPAKTLLELLGSEAVSRSVRVRRIQQMPAAPELRAHVSYELESLLSDMFEQEITGIARSRIPSPFNETTGLSMASESLPLPIPLVHDGDPDAIDAIVAGRRIQPASVFQALASLAWEQVDAQVAIERGSVRFQETVALATNVPVEERAAVEALLERADQVEPAALFAQAERIAQRTPEAASKADFMVPGVGDVGYADLAHDSSSIRAQRFFANAAIEAVLVASGHRAELRQALLALKGTTLDERHWLFGESLDVASHRLDAWITGLVDRRRVALRGKTPQGITVGAFGWVEGIEPGTDGDYRCIHALSPQHAVTAGILRSAYLSHRAAGEDGVFAIDLSSARVRDAMSLLEAGRNGQGLSAMLGYRVERAMQERRLGRFILNLRELAPLLKGKLSDRDAPGSMTEAPGCFAASAVVDGVRLLEIMKEPGGWDRILDAVNDEPTDNAYMVPGSWAGASQEEAEDLQSILQSLAGTLDAAMDLLLAESVHQFAGGSPEKATVALDAAGTGDVPLPRPDVVLTPPAGRLLEQRLLIVVGDAASGSWRTDTPRARAEPALEAWAGARMGDPGAIVVHVAADSAVRTFAETGLSALDLIYASADPAALAREIRRRLNLAADAALAETRDPTWPAGRQAYGEMRMLAAGLHRLLLAAMPAAGSDLGPGYVESPRAIDLSDAQARTEAALAGLVARRQIGSANDARALAIEFGITLPAALGDATAMEIVAAEADRRIEAAEAVLAAAGPLGVDALASASQAIFGDGFWLVPRILPPAGPDTWSTAAAPADASPGAIRRWFADFGTVRDAVRLHADTLLLGDALGLSSMLRVAQVAEPDAAGRLPTGWVGATRPQETHYAGESLSLVMEVHGFAGPDAAMTVLRVDDFSERLPASDEQQRMSGISFNAPAPSSRPPQAMLLAIAPDERPWSSQTLEETLRDTLELAKLRTVTLQDTLFTARILPALYVRSWSLQGHEPAIDFKAFVKGAPTVEVISKYTREQFDAGP